MSLLSSNDNMSYNNQLKIPLQTCYKQLQGQWRALVCEYMRSEAGKQLQEFVDTEVSSGKSVFPATPFLALELTPLEEVSVVIIGQDPYHGPNQAQGLSFSVAEDVKIPPSLRNMYKELEQDLAIPPAKNGSLIRWAKQGVLLLNATLTVRQSEPASHAKKGWETLTDKLITAVAQKKEPVVFMLWGNYAQAKEKLILEAAQKMGVEHLILKANHPSPLAALRPPIPFMGCGHFGQANHYLLETQRKPINW